MQRWEHYFEKVRGPFFNDLKKWKHVMFCYMFHCCPLPKINGLLLKFFYHIKNLILVEICAFNVKRINVLQLIGLRIGSFIFFTKNLLINVTFNYLKVMSHELLLTYEYYCPSG